jgi:hypothetical protein
MIPLVGGRIQDFYEMGGIEKHSEKIFRSKIK